MLFFGQNLENQYVSSKFLAEREVLKAATKGLDAKIMRMGNLMARNRDGEFQINPQANSFLGRLRAYQAVGSFPYSAYLSLAELAPIDSSAQAVILLSETPPECRVFHPYNNHYIFLGDIIMTMAESGIAVELMEDEDFQRALSAALRDKARAERLVSLIAYQNVAQGKVAMALGSKNDYTSQILYRMGWRWPETSADYLKKFLEGMIGLGYFEDVHV
jgi:thioester reductase-like protein